MVLWPRFGQVPGTIQPYIKLVEALLTGTKPKTLHKKPRNDNKKESATHTMFALFISQSTCAQSWNLDHTTHAVSMKVTFGCDLRRASIGAFDSSSFVDRFTSFNAAISDIAGA